MGAQCNRSNDEDERSFRAGVVDAAAEEGATERARGQERHTHAQTHAPASRQKALGSRMRESAEEQGRQESWAARPQAQRSGSLDSNSAPARTAEGNAELGGKSRPSGANPLLCCAVLCVSRSVSVCLSVCLCCSQPASAQHNISERATTTSCVLNNAPL